MNAKNIIWLDRRQSGVLMHISSLPGEYGIGNIGRTARDFVDLIAEAGFAYWQICPVGPTGYADSPYQSFSTHAGNPYFIDISKLIEENLLTQEDTQALCALSDDYVDYGGLYENFWTIIAKAASNFLTRSKEISGFMSLDEFYRVNTPWLDAYSLFMGLKKYHKGRPWYEWEMRYRSFANIDRLSLPVEVTQEAERHKVYQYLFFWQWKTLRDYASNKGISIIGDLPIFVAHDSADVWQNPEVFRIDSKGHLLVSAGVPPDYFSESGQFWGNPLYDWEHLKSTGYQWWMNRLNGAMLLFDAIRLDHFRAFSSYWEIPGSAPDARTGQWVKGPGIDFFNAVQKRFSNIHIIAEDLGYIDYGVYHLRESVSLPGMKILQFGFGHDTNNVNLPHFYTANSVVYTGTHDNDTTRGWLSKTDAYVKAKVSDYFQSGNDNSAWPMIRAAFMSVSRLAIIPMQDLLDLDSSARMNTPGTSWGNWKWRVSTQQINKFREEKMQMLHKLHYLSDRTGKLIQSNFSIPPESTEIPLNHVH